MEFDIHALLDKYRDDVRQGFERRRGFQEQLRTTEVTCESPDRMLKLTQTCDGRTVEVTIRPGAFDKYDERAFAKLMTDILKSSHDATRWAARKMSGDAESGRS